MSAVLAVNLKRLWFETDGCRFLTLPRSAIFETTDWLVISVVGGVILVKSTDFSPSNPRCTRHSVQFWTRQVFLRV